jgi:hypothetical protein
MPLIAFGSLSDLYRSVVAGVGSTPWGAVPLSVPEENLPTVLPLQVAFELRPIVEAASGEIRLPQSRRHLPCAIGLADTLKQVQQAIDSGVAVRLALEVVFGTAKMAPMSRRAFATVSGSDAASRG